MSRNHFPSTSLPVKALEVGAANTRKPQTNRYAIAAAICAVLGFVTAVGFVGGVICGHIALIQIRRTHEGGRRLAIGALIVSWLPLVLVAAVFALLFLLGRFTVAQGG